MIRKYWYKLKYSILSKILLSVACTVVIVYFLPKGTYFEFEFQKGKPWLNKDLLAPFDFAILKSEKELEEEQENLRKGIKPYFRYNDSIKDKSIQLFKENFQKSNIENLETQKLALEYGVKILSDCYQNGIKRSRRNISFKEISLVKKNTVSTISFDDIKDLQSAKNDLLQKIDSSKFKNYKNEFETAFFQSILINVDYDQDLTQKEIKEKEKEISKTYGFIIKNTRIISKGEIVEDTKYDILRSLKKEYKSKTWDVSNYSNLLIGYFLVISLIYSVLLLYLYFFYKKSIFDKNKPLIFILFNMLWVDLITIFLVETNAQYIYIAPICILPLIISSFYDSRIGIFLHTLNVLLLGFVAPNSFQFIFLQMIAGVFTIGTKKNQHRRSSIFSSVLKMLLAYMVTDICLSSIKEGVFDINYIHLLYLVINSLLTLFTQPLIYLYEKLFGFTSSTSLLELSDTNSKLLRALSEKAMGTFQHSLQVANIAEAAANKIGANALLVRAGALYHDIGKMENSLFFTENQFYVSNPHDKKQPKESAEIIINHVKKGMITAKKNNLPEEIINFIDTHHGNSLVYFFYKKSLNIDPKNTREEDFRYPNPKPNSKETVILMMCDSCEAASKSIKNHSLKNINELVDNIVKNQLIDGQFSNADITFREVEQVKGVIKLRLQSIYNIREKYPELQ